MLIVVALAAIVTASAAGVEDTVLPWPMVGQNAGQTCFAATVVGPKTGAALNYTFEQGGSSAAVSSNTTYVTSGEGIVYALDAAGNTVWSYQLGDRSDSSPALYNGMLFVGASDQQLYALDATTGALLWTFQTQGEIVASPIIDTITGNVYIGSDDHTFYAISAVSGKPVWTYSSNTDVSNPVAVGPDGTVYMTVQASVTGNVFAFSGATGKTLWKAQLPAKAVPSGPAYYDGLVFLTAYNSAPNVFAFNATSGAAVWTATIGAEIEASPTVASDGTVYIGSNDNQLHSYNGLTGLQNWVFQVTAGNIRANPAIDGGNTVYIGSDDRNVYAVNGNSGVLMWALEVNGNPKYLSIGPNVLYVTLFDGALLSLR